MNKFLGRKFIKKNDDDPSRDESKDIREFEFQKRELYNKGINYMANEKLNDAIRAFDLALRVDPEFVDAWIKKGYSHFHLNEFPIAISCYDKALDIDINNSEPWNLKSLAYYKMNNLEKAIESCEKSIDINPDDGMAWYNLACYQVLSGKVDEGVEALKKSIELDISNAKKAVKDRDFENAKAEEGFRRIIEVVVIEAIRQGYDYVGKIVWISGMDRIDVEDALMRLTMKGLVIKKEKRNFFNKEESYELTKDIASKIGTISSGFLGNNRKLSPPLQQLKDISELLGQTKDHIEKGNVQETLKAFEKLINPSIHGSVMIEKFFNEHRDLRLFNNRIKDNGQQYLNIHKADILNLLDVIDSKLRGNPISN